MLFAVYLGMCSFYHRLQNSFIKPPGIQHDVQINLSNILKNFNIDTYSKQSIKFLSRKIFLIFKEH